MPAGCYHCAIGTSAIPGKSKTDAFGACRICHVLACAAHAVRDPNAPRWICVSCDVTLLANSAVVASSGTAPGGATTLLAQLFSSAVLRDEARYQSLDAFLAAQPAFAFVRAEIDGVIKLANERLHEGDVGRLWQELSDEGRKLMAAAVVIARRLELNSDELIEGVRILINRLYRNR